MNFTAKFKRLIITSIVIVLANLLTKIANSQESYTDPRGEPELTICSQNLENLGTFEQSRVRTPGLTAVTYELKVAGLIKRIEAAGCDVVAVQEVIGKKEEEAQASLDTFTARLSRTLGRPFVAKVALTGDGSIRSGFLIAQDKVSIINLISYDKIELPRIVENQKARTFDRAPLELQLEVRQKGGINSKIVTLLNIHLKSRASTSEDPTGLQFETLRMEMAEGIRRLIEIRHSNIVADPDKIFILLGDRNTDMDMAAAKILDGSLALMDFQEDGACRLSKRGLPLCKTEKRRPQKFFSPLTMDDMTRGVAGTYVYKDTPSWIDDILLPLPHLKYVRENTTEDHNYYSGTVSKPKVASDHALIFVRLNW